MLYLFFFKPLRDHLRGFLIAAWAGDKIAEFSFPEISFHFPLRPWFFFVSPAYAGKSLTAFCGNTGRKDHPRVCGEKASEYTCPLISLGSPPRMRGKVQTVSCGTTLNRITPAYAGKSKLTFDAGQLIPGSPPRMRGKETLSAKQVLTRRITPAYAGKSHERPSYFRRH